MMKQLPVNHLLWIRKNGGGTLHSLFISILLAAALNAGCASQEVKQPTARPPNADLQRDGQSLSADLYVEQNNKSVKLKSEINLINDNAVRLDLLSTLDLPLASILITDSKIEYVLFRDKKYYVGRPGPHALDPVFPLTIDIPRLVSILREESYPGEQCEYDQGIVTECKGLIGQTAYVVTWSQRGNSGPLAGRARKVVLDLPQRQVMLRFYFNDWQKQTDNAERLLTLKVPEGFKTLRTP